MSPYKERRPNMFGVSICGVFRQCSETERGAKSYATRHGYKEVYYCSPYSWSCVCVATRVLGKWVPVATVPTSRPISQPLKKAKPVYPIPKDKRYTVAKEFCGHTKAMFVLRFCGEFVASSAFYNSLVVRAAGHNASSQLARKLSQKAQQHENNSATNDN